ncbi:hypothetical protein [Luteolibacter sp.]
MAVEVDFFEFLAGIRLRVFFLDDLGVAGGVVRVGQVGGDALGQAGMALT